MNDSILRARLLNSGGELIAEGVCKIDERAGLAMLEPERETGAIYRQRGALVLELESGRSLPVGERPLVMRVRPPARTGGRNGHGPDHGHARTYIRMRIARRAHDVAAAGAEDDGPSSQQWEAPAAR